MLIFRKEIVCMFEQGYQVCYTVLHEFCAQKEISLVYKKKKI